MLRLSIALFLQATQQRMDAQQAARQAAEGATQLAPMSFSGMPMDLARTCFSVQCQTQEQQSLLHVLCLLSLHTHAAVSQAACTCTDDVTACADEEGGMSLTEQLSFEVIHRFLRMTVQCIVGSISSRIYWLTLLA